MSNSTIKVFGHKSPDTDATCSAIIAAWYYTNILDKPATPYILGELNPETKFVLDHWGVETPKIIDRVEDGDQVVIVDTNNREELPDNLENAEILEIIDHHRLMGNLKTAYVVKVTIQPLASTGSILGMMMGEVWENIPRKIKGLILSCVLSDTLEFRSPTTTKCDQEAAQALTDELGVSIPEYAAQMFEAKSDVSDYSDEELVKMDSKVGEFDGQMYRVGVVETASPKVVLARQAGLMEAQAKVAQDENLAEAFLFVVDILNEEAILLIPNENHKRMAELSFNVKVQGDTVVLPGIVSRKKQIIPNLKV